MLLEGCGRAGGTQHKMTTKVMVVWYHQGGTNDREISNLHKKKKPRNMYLDCQWARQRASGNEESIDKVRGSAGGWQEVSDGWERKC